MTPNADPLRLALEVGLYVFFFLLSLWLFVLSGIAALVGAWMASALGTCAAAVVANVLTLQIYEGRRLPDIGCRWSSASAHNLAWGLAGGVAGALAVLAIPLAMGAASLQPGSEGHWRTLLFVAVMLAFGAAGEELLFRGYGFQVLLRSIGPYATILPVGVMFGWMHASNPNASRLGLVNTAGFGVLFGYAFLRSRDLWLPFGLHYGWNLTLPLFGASVSGIKMGVLGYEFRWSARPLWSGGEYGPEASILTSGVLMALFAFLWKAPIRAQPNRLLDECAEK
jgi:membrane protease YdiL (CAAX protease family)